MSKGLEAHGQEVGVSGMPSWFRKLIHWAPQEGDMITKDLEDSLSYAASTQKLLEAEMWTQRMLNRTYKLRAEVAREAARYGVELQLERGTTKELPIK